MSGSGGATTVYVSSGSTATDDGTGPLTNYVVDGGTLDLVSGWQSGGTVSEQSGSVAITGTFSTADLLGIDRSGGALLLEGTLDNGGAVLDLGRIAGATIEGRVSGGTIVGSGTDVTFAGQNGNAVFLTDTVIQGTIDLGAGYVILSGIANQGTITGENSITDVLDGAWTNSGGTIELSNTPLFLAGSFTTPDLGTIQTDSRVYFDGTWNLQGGTFDATAPGPLDGLIDYGGTFENGTIANSDALTFGFLQGATFAGVTLQGGLASESAFSPYNLRVESGTTVTAGGDGQYLLRDAYGNVDIDQDLTFGGTADSYDGSLVIGQGDVFTLGTTGAIYGNQTVTGQGTLVSYGSLIDNIQGLTVTTIFVNHGTVTSVPYVGQYGGITLTGSATNAADGSIDDNGSISGPFENDGVVTADHGTLSVGQVSGSGRFAIAGSGRLDLGNGAAQTVTFASGTGSLVLHGAVQQTGLVSLMSGDTIDFPDLVFRSGGSVTSAGDVDTFTVGGVSESVPVGAGGYFTFAKDDASGTEATFATCYAAGTPILTDQGERAIEALRIGDLVMTERGAEPVRWIGRRSYDGPLMVGTALVLPVCFKAGSIAERVPSRDLWVSPGHGMLLGGVLVPAWRLVNGVSVVQPEDARSVTYYHVELARHALLVASGAAAESFLDDGCRSIFQNAVEFESLYPEHATMSPVAPRVEDGLALQCLRERLAARAGLFAVPEPVGRLGGYVDQAETWRASGWAQDADEPEAPVWLEIAVGGRPVLCVLANAFRADLRAAGLGSGCHAFDVSWAADLSGRPEVRRVSDRAPLALTADLSSALARRAA